jgi:enoyl-CoA hydratase/carnithine racemase
MHGITLGLGIDLACCCDIRICTEDVKFAVKEVDIGLAADVGTLTRLPKIVGNYGWVKEVCLTARYFGAQEALQVGFVGRVVNDKSGAIEAGLQVAELLASKSPIAVQSTKHLLDYSHDHNIEDGQSKYLISGNGSKVTQVYVILVFGILWLCRQLMCRRPCYQVLRNEFQHLRSFKILNNVLYSRGI